MIAQFKEQDSAHKPVSYIRYGSCSCVIDSGGIIHIVYMDSNGDTPAVRYVTFDTNTNLFSGDIAVIEDIGDNASTVTNLHCGISVDANNVPHIAYNSRVSSYYCVYYNNKVGGSWKSTSIELKGPALAKSFFSTSLIIDKDNKPVVTVFNMTDGIITSLIGDSNDASSFTSKDIAVDADPDGSYLSCSACCDCNGNIWVAYRQVTTGYIKVVKHLYGEAWSTWQAAITDSKVGYNPNITMLDLGCCVFYTNVIGNTAVIKEDVYSSGGVWSGEVTIASPFTGSPALYFNNRKVKTRSQLRNDSFNFTYGIDLLVINSNDNKLYYTNTKVPGDLYTGVLKTRISGNFVIAPKMEQTGGSMIGRPTYVYLNGEWKLVQTT